MSISCGVGVRGKGEGCFGVGVLVFGGVGARSSGVKRLGVGVLCKKEGSLLKNVRTKR